MNATTATFQFKPLTADEVTFSLAIENEDIPVQGAFESGDDEQDRSNETEINARLDRGDLWAWCTVKVTATWKSWSADDYLGCCSYDNEKDFRAGGYYETMCDQALDALNAKIKAHAEELAARYEVSP